MLAKVISNVWSPALNESFFPVRNSESPGERGGESVEFLEIFVIMDD